MMRKVFINNIQETLIKQHVYTDEKIFDTASSNYFCFTESTKPDFYIKP